MNKVMSVIFIVLLFAPNILMSKTSTQMDIYSSLSVTCAVFAGVLLGMKIVNDIQDMKS